MYRVDTNYPLAADSPDHKNPHGARFGGTSSPRFIDEIERLLGPKLRTLALGCSGGRLVKDLADRGHDSCGLEGSDYHVQHQSGSWPVLHNDRLFTCDISRPFQVMRDGEPALFDVVTMWDVLEHISTKRLETTFKNIYKHLDAKGLLIGTIGLTPSPHPKTGVELHQTVQPKAWWRDRLDKYFEYAGVDLINRDAWHDMVCWHGAKKDQNWSTWIVMRPRPTT